MSALINSLRTIAEYAEGTGATDSMTVKRWCLKRAEVESRLLDQNEVVGRAIASHLQGTPAAGLGRPELSRLGEVARRALENENAAVEATR